MLEAVIFDFDGVVVDSEPIHMAGFQQVLQERFGITLTRDEYYQRYLAYTDAEAFALILAEHRRPMSEPLLAELIADKSQMVHALFAADVQPMPGVIELMTAARQAGLAVGICSGALRGEIEQAARAVGAWRHVQALVAAEDVPTGKPDPAGYDLARRRLGAARGRDLPPAACVAIEDAPAGIAAAKAAGMTALAVTNSMERDMLARADRVVTSLEHVGLDDLRAMVS